MKTKNKKAITILSICIAATLTFIWIHSCMGQEESSQESGFIYDLLCPFFELFVGKGNVTEHFIRKLAHFTEFFGLGLELKLLMKLVLLDTPYILRMINAWTLGTMCALIDETIQIFSGRGPAIADVWLDSAGCLTGVLLMSLIIIIVNRHIRKKEERASIHNS
ncbi:MAG: VanZ family protein [Lachnospiraceae bacterium]|nr:VanZ family protein [Lachnospiraceae bacterium]